jgi:PIN domain nuclease of toxin-antitoxin system
VAAVIYLDTHVVAWLFAGDHARLSRAARLAIETHDLLVSPAVILELECLHETKRTSAPGAAVVGDLASRIGLRVCELPFADVTRAALGQHWTRDPFDRLILGQAAVRATPLLTKDRAIRRRYPPAIW